MMQNIIVFGASGGIGSQAVRQALDKGHAVTAVVRNPPVFQLKHPNLLVVKGDVLDLASFIGTMEGQDAVISALGTGNVKPTILYSQGIRNIIAAMQAYGVSRILAISAGGLYINDTMGPLRRFLVTNVLQRMLKEPYADLRLMEKELQATNLRYSIIRPPRLTNKPLTGEYRLAINSHLKTPYSISRADVAHCLVNQLENGKTFKSIIEIAY